MLAGRVPVLQPPLKINGSELDAAPAQMLPANNGELNRECPKVSVKPPATFPQLPVLPNADDRPNNCAR